MLEVARLDAFYGESHIVQDVSFSVGEGERVALIGRNGAGKTTILKSLMNAGPRVAGAVRWDGRDLGDAPTFRRARLGLSLVPEDRRILPQITVLENLEMAARGVRGFREARDPRAVLAAFPMLVPLEQRPGERLSGGQQQLLAFARAIVARPRLLLLDEPTEGLAPVIVQQLADAVARACREMGTALLLCEQNLWFARRCAERVHIIDSGRVVFSGDWPAFDADVSVRQRFLAV